MSLAEKLMNLLTEKFKGVRGLKVESLTSPPPGEKWCIVVDRIPYSIFVAAYVNGKFKVGIGPISHWDGISNVIWVYKYYRRFKRAKTEEERKKIRQEKEEFEDKAFHDFMQGKYEKYLDDKGLDYTTRKHIWANEIARRLSNKHGLSIEFVEDWKCGFKSTFDSSGMSEEKVIEEIMKMVDIMLEAEKMYGDDGMMNDFLISKGIKLVNLEQKARASG